MEPVKVGVIGVGNMGANHARVYDEMSRAHLVGVCDANNRVAWKAAEECDCRYFQQLEDLLDGDVEAVSIAVPTTLHAEVAEAALNAGVHVLVEKPIAATVKEADSLIRLADQRNCTLMVGHIERFNPTVQAVKKVVGDERIISINVTRVGPLPPRIKDAGVIIDLSVHDIDIVHYLTGELTEHVYCVRSSNVAAKEDSASLLLRTASGTSAQITTNWLTPFKAREIQVVTPKRLIKGDLLSQQVQEFRDFSGEDQSYVVRDVRVNQHEPLRAQLDAFVRSVRHGTAPAVPGRAGREALQVALNASSFNTLTAV